MTAWILNRRALTTTFVFSALLLLVFGLWGYPLNIVAYDYLRAAYAFSTHVSPYQFTAHSGSANQFKYSPLFAAFFSLFLQHSKRMFGFAWYGIGIFTFWLGVCRWWDFSRRIPSWSKRLTLDFLTVCVFVEVFTTMSAFQSNCLIVGLTLLGLAEYRDQRFVSAGALLMLAANLKVYPVIFLVALALRLRPRFWAGMLMAGLVAFLIPGVILGMKVNLAWHREWVSLVLDNATGIKVLDVSAAFERVGQPLVGSALKTGLAIIAPLLFFGSALKGEAIDWADWIAFGLASLLLLSPRTEVPTFILAAPAYFLLAAHSRERLTGSKALLRYGLLLTAAALISLKSCILNDPTYITSEIPERIYRVAGTLVLWFSSGIHLAVSLWTERPRVEVRLRTLPLDRTSPEGPEPTPS